MDSILFSALSTFSPLPSSWCPPPLPPLQTSPLLAYVPTCYPELVLDIVAAYRASEHPFASPREVGVGVGGRGGLVAQKADTCVLIQQDPYRVVRVRTIIRSARLSPLQHSFLLADPMNAHLTVRSFPLSPLSPSAPSCVATAWMRCWMEGVVALTANLPFPSPPSPPPSPLLPP